MLHFMWHCATSTRLPSDYCHLMKLYACPGIAVRVAYLASAFRLGTTTASQVEAVAS